MHHILDVDTRGAQPGKPIAPETKRSLNDIALLKPLTGCDETYPTSGITLLRNTNLTKLNTAGSMTSRP